MMKVFQKIFVLSLLLLFSACTGSLAPNAVTLSTPGLTVNAGVSVVSLAWTPSTAEGSITYDVMRSTSSVGGYTSIASDLGTTSFNDTSVSNGTTYYYQIVAKTGLATQSSSNQASALPMANFSATSAISGVNTLKISWPAVPGATGYQLKYGTTAGTYTSTLENVTSPVLVSSLSPGTMQYFQVTASNGVGNGNSVKATASGIPIDATYYRVTSYGATGDGVTDDAAAIQSAMNAALTAGSGTVFFDPGTYRLVATGQLSETNWGTPFSMNFLGNQATLTSSVLNTSMLMIQGKWRNSYIKGLKFVNTHGVTTTGTQGLYFEGGGGNQIQNITVSDCSFNDFSVHIVVAGVTGLAFSNNAFVMDQGRDSGTSTNTVPNVGIWMHDNNPNGNSVNVTISNNTYNGCGNLTSLASSVSKSCGDGFIYGQALNSTYSGNTIRGFSAEGIAVAYSPTAGTPVTVSGNTIDGTMISGDQFGGGGWGIRADANGTIIQSNLITNCGTGIFSCSYSGCGSTTTATGLQVSGNTILTRSSGTQPFEYGIEFIGSGSSTISNNTITFYSGTIRSGSELNGIGVLGVSGTALDSMTVTGNTIGDTLSSQGSFGSAGIYGQYLTNWTISGNTMSGFSYGLDFNHQTGTTAQLNAILGANTTTGNGTSYRLQNGSF